MTATRTKYTHGMRPRRALVGLSFAATIGAFALTGCGTAGHTPAAARPNGTAAVALPAGTSSASAAGVPAASPSGSAASPAGHPRGAPPAPVQAAKLPGNAVQSWHPIAAAQNLPTVHDVRLNECQTVHGAITWQQQGYESSHDTPAVQDTFVFAAAVTADGAYQSLLTAMAGCQGRSRDLQSAAKLPADATVTQTAQTSAGTAWARGWTGVGGISAPGAQTNHIYMVHRGAVLTVLQITDFPGKTPANAIDPTDDGEVLATLAANLDA